MSGQHGILMLTLKQIYSCFFLGNAINNRDALIDSGIILPVYMSVFKIISDMKLLDDQTTKAIFKPIGIPQSLEEISIKFDLLGI